MIKFVNDLSYVQSVSINIKVVSSNTDHGEAYSIQHYVMKFISLSGGWFSLGTPVSSDSETYRHDITEL